MGEGESIVAQERNKYLARLLSWMASDEQDMLLMGWDSSMVSTS